MTAQPPNRFVFLCCGRGVCCEWTPDFVSFLYKDKWWWLTLFISCLPVFFTEYCHKLCIQRQMVVRWKHVSYFLYGKYLKNNFLFPLHIELNLKTLLWNWRGSPWRPGRMKSIIQKGIIQCSYWPIVRSIRENIWTEVRTERSEVRTRS